MQVVNKKCPPTPPLFSMQFKTAAKNKLFGVRCEYTVTVNFFKNRQESGLEGGKLIKEGTILLDIPCKT